MTERPDELGELASAHDALPRVTDALSGYLAAVDAMPGLDRKTHELIRLTCTVILRHAPGVERHAMLATEFGATWEEVLGTLVLTQPTFGLVPAREMVGHARAGFEAGVTALADGEGPDGGTADVSPADQGPADGTS